MFSASSRVRRAKSRRTRSDDTLSFQPSDCRFETSSLNRVERPPKLGLRYTVTAASPNTRTDEIRSFSPSGIWS